MAGLLRKRELNHTGVSCSEQRRDKKEDVRVGEGEEVDEREDEPQNREV